MSAQYAWSERFPVRPPVTKSSDYPTVSPLGDLHPPATEAEVRQLEERLGMELPPGYRQFLLFANGWGSDDDCCLLRVKEVGWLRDVDPPIAESWSAPKRENSWSVPDELYGMRLGCSVPRTALLGGFGTSYSPSRLGG
ncbi:SMI1/KNR4 family protein [Nonomuraea sp. NPDC050022]|uniref:SMI1/KNR4 family protein n=1 Tax=unclassified Nonomuraea TaxID=2593643 RepID=UPI0033E494C8